MKANELETVSCPKCGEIMVVPKEEALSAECWNCGAKTIPTDNTCAWCGEELSCDCYEYDDELYCDTDCVVDAMEHNGDLIYRIIEDV